MQQSRQQRATMGVSRHSIAALLLLSTARSAVSLTLEESSSLRVNAAASSKNLRSKKGADRGDPFGRLVPVAPPPITDDVMPVAPFDSVAGPDADGTTIDAAGATPQGDAGTQRPALYVPPYLYPDAFPSSSRNRCVCKAPKVEKATPEEKQWAREVARTLGVPISQVMKPADFVGIAKCDCGDAPRLSTRGQGQLFRWVKSVPFSNGTGYELRESDPSFPNGNYFEPEVQGVTKSGLVAPLDGFAGSKLPVQAPMDAMPNFQGKLAIGDFVDKDFSRYLDQLQQKKAECDQLSEECTNPCKAGDKVVFELGNARVMASIVSTSVGNAATIEYQAHASLGVAKTVECPIEAGCSIFRPCLPNELKDGVKHRCQKQESEASHDIVDETLVVVTTKCPGNTTVCKMIKQEVMATYLRTQDGKLCRAV
eukprot:TRINITY_DN109461_c0_g1_i1.p1 TRINITY_DN109461_c0_g1~~TRINITY_DN109461_c0_g1_i1.p1  ORF type:complete len:425 (+),score=99.99 TRINITY_DN109461_c0_g1_i1:53-1327(+)